MADDRCLSVSEPLCFAFGRFGKLNEKQLKQILIDFFNVEQLFVAKNRLCEDIGNLQLEAWPRPSQHRGSDKQARLEVDDIFAMITFLDEQLLLEKVPIYVCENIDRIPSVRWMDGDFQLILAKLNTMQEFFNVQLENMQQTIDTLVRQNTALSESKLQHELETIANSKKMIEMEECFQRELVEQGKHFNHRIDELSSLAASTAYTLTTIQSSIHGQQGHRPGASAALASASALETNSLPCTQSMGLTGESCGQPTDMQCDVPPVQQQGDNRQPCWADKVALATPTAFRPARAPNQNTKLNYPSSTAAESEDDGGNYQASSYQQRQQRRQLKRYRAEENPSSSERKQPQRQQQHQQTRFKLVGKSSNSKLKAFAELVEKRVFSVANVHNSYTKEDIKGFLTEIGIRVVTVGDAKTKFDGKAFRVSIVAEDTDRFTVPDIWPENVIIRPWYFKSNQNSE